MKELFVYTYFVLDERTEKNAGNTACLPMCGSQRLYCSAGLAPCKVAGVVVALTRQHFPGLDGSAVSPPHACMHAAKLARKGFSLHLPRTYVSVWIYIILDESTCEKCGLTLPCLPLCGSPRLCRGIGLVPC